MKSTIKLGIFSLTLFMFSNFQAQIKTFEAKVEGNCGMCKKRIEKAAKADQYVNSADWNKTSKILTVNYESSKTDKRYILKNVSNNGYDNELFRSSIEAYENLEDCCQYSRPKNETTGENCDTVKVCKLK